jgi:hypothetical protein
VTSTFTRRQRKRTPALRGLWSWFNGSSGERSPHKTARSRLRCEELETRQLLSTYLVGVTDPAATWHSIDDVNNFAATTGFGPGDQILFESGQTFNGNLYLQSPDQQMNMGTPDAPITIGSYDPNDPTNPFPVPATIAAGQGYGIKVFNAAGFHITDLTLRGGWNPEVTNRNSSDGIIFDGNLGTGVVLPYVHIDNVAISGFGTEVFDFNKGDGILFGNTNGIACAYNDVSVTDSVISQVVSNGIYSRANISNLLLDHITIHDVYGLTNVNSGYGIHMWNLNGAVVQHCEVFNTGIWGGDTNSAGPDGGGGPVGIDVSNSSYVLFQYNDSHDNHDRVSGDGLGFDFDEHTTNSIMQYNYSHDNDGAGYMLGTWLSSGAMNAHNILRYNLSENDCRRWDEGSILLENPAVTDADIYNNTIYLSPNINGGGWHGNDGFSAIRIPITGQVVRFYNNVIVTTAGIPALSVESNTGPGLLFLGNVYYAAGWVPTSAQPLVSWGGVPFGSLDQWRSATGYSQESFAGAAVGSQGTVPLVNPGLARRIDNPTDPNYVSNHIDQLGALLAAYYGSNSPLLGVDETQLGTGEWDPFGFSTRGGPVETYWMPPQDFTGQTFAWGGDSDPHAVGAFQFPAGA